MATFVEDIVSSAERNMGKAANNEDVNATTFYGDQAIVLLLVGILQQLTKILEHVKKS